MSPSPQRPDRDVALRILLSTLSTADGYVRDAIRERATGGMLVDTRVELALARVAALLDLNAHHLAVARERED